MKALEESLSFAFHKKLGYLTSSLANVGTGLRVSFRVSLPHLERKIIDSMAQKGGIQVRPKATPEQIYPINRVYELSNMKKICFTVKELS